MSYQHQLLGEALGWKYPGRPRIMTTDGVLSQWPTDIAAEPDDAAQAQAVADYQAYRASNQAKDDGLQAFLDSPGGRVAKAIVGALVSKGVLTQAEIRTAYRALA